VGRQLSGRHLLLVFDNAEHLADFGRSCETLAAAAPHAKLLVTSRVRLGARGEWLLPIDGLPLPDRDEHDAGVLRVFDAVALFEARARSLAPGFDLAAQAADVVALCHAVEGLPLALELAAAWTRVLPVAGIVRELRHSLDLLAAPAGAGTRDRSLRASFEHSWRLLAPAEREVLPRLAVFAGSFSRAAAEAVARAALPVLAALVDKSLLRASGDGRFSLHPLLRQCAAERAPDAHAVRIAHAEHYATLLANQAVEDPARVLSGVELELPNLLLAWQTAIDARLAPLVERMAAPLGRFFDVRARFAEGEQVMRGTMPAFGGGTKPERRALARVRLVLGTMQLRQARFADCEDSARLALRGFIATRDRRGMAGALNSLGVCAWQRGHYDDAIGCLERGARRARADGDDVQADRMEVNVALVEEALGHYERAVKRLQACVASQRRTGRELDLVQTLNNIAGLHRLQQQPAAAIAYLEESMQLAQELGHLQNQAHQLANLALAWIDCGDADRAQPLAQQALTLAREHGARQIEVVSLLALSRTAFAKGDVARARSDARAALRVAHELGHEVLQLSALATRAWIDAPGGADAGAAVLLQFVIFDRRTEAHDRNAAGAVLASLALPEDALRNVREAAANMTLGQAVAAILAELRNCG
jgi:predicted ATPase